MSHLCEPARVAFLVVFVAQGRSTASAMRSFSHVAALRVPSLSSLCPSGLTRPRCAASGKGERYENLHHHHRRAQGQAEERADGDVQECGGNRRNCCAPVTGARGRRTDDDECSLLPDPARRALARPPHGPSPAALRHHESARAAGSGSIARPTDLPQTRHKPKKVGVDNGGFLRVSAGPICGKSGPEGPPLLTIHQLSH